MKEWDYCKHDFDITEKHRNVHNMIKYYLDRTSRMFVYEGLPDTIPAHILEQFLQINGNCVFAEINDKYYVVVGGKGGEINEYYEETVYTVANPVLGSFNFTIHSGEKNDCVLIKNDTFEVGLIPLLNKYSSLIADNEITMRMADINLRMFNILSASDDDTAESAKEYLNQIEEGKQGVIGEEAFFDGIKLNPGASAGSANYLTQLIEYHNFLRSNCFNELGLQSNNNMKRERLNSDEVNANVFTFLPLIDDMLLNRQEALKKINEKYGLNISVRLGSAWELQDTQVVAMVEEAEMLPDDKELIDNSTTDDIISEEEEDKNEGED